MQLFNLANALTLLNLFSGCVAIVFMFNYYMEYVPYCVLVSLVADFLDGFAARFTKSSTEIGKQLDSLADVVSFGVVPGCILFQMLFMRLESEPAGYSATKMFLMSAPAFLVTLFAALRLAKFNLDTRQSDGFIGLATPAATVFVVGLLLVYLDNTFGLAGFAYGRKLLYVTCIALPVLMISELPMFAFKFKSFGWKGNEVRYVFIILSAILLAALKFAAVSLIIVLYILFSLVLKYLNK
jgi:CDP-diacylglycerol--serine O-phosphatidyltransferase